jgi:peptide chain release factor 1
LVKKLATSLIPEHPFATLPCLVELIPGVGGSEASLFAQELLDMYTGLASRLRVPHSLQIYTPDESVGGTTALTHAILEISSPNAYNLLKSEAGVHRVQRIPATERKGRTHTSVVTVLILPSLPETDADNAMNYADPSSDYYISPADVRVETMRARGPGGQHVNKTESAIRLTHIPTGLVVAMQDSRSQHANREKAWTLLRAKLATGRREARENEAMEMRRRTMGGVGRTGRDDKVRTYNFSQNRVTDHRSSWEGGDVDDIMAGGTSLEDCMRSVRSWMTDRELAGLTAEEEAKSRG